MRRITPLLKRLSGAAALSLALSGAAAAQEPWDAAEWASDAVAVTPQPSPAWEMADWVMRTKDNSGLPFAIVDKTGATVFVFGADGVFLGAAPVLLGSAVGDDSTPGVGDRELSDIAPEERTTPAGRFMASYGPATGGKRVLWVDYGTAISLHEVVTTNRKERRPQRLASETVADNRITFGCINVAPEFYKEVVKPTFEGTQSVFYVLPETKSMVEAFPRLVLAGDWQGAGGLN